MTCCKAENECMNFKAAIFDMDGTLVDSLMLWDVLWEELGKTFLNDPGFRPTVEDDTTIRTMTLKAAMELTYERYHLGESSEQLHQVAAEKLKNFYITQVELKPGVLEWLQYLKNQGIRMCIASATVPELVRLVMKKCGVDGFFDGLFSCGDIGKGKDHPDVFLMALEHLGTKAEETCVFEDSLVAVQTAAKAGFQTVGIYDRYNYGHTQMKRIATAYIAEGETLAKLIR